MAVENDFLAFAIAVGANVATQGDYAASSYVQEGFQAGIAESDQLNKVWRQSSFISAMIAGYIVNETGDAMIDDGDLTGKIALFTAAIQVSSGIKPSRVLTTSVATAILLTDYRVAWNRTAGVAALTATLPAGAAIGQSFRLGDVGNNAQAFPISVAPNAGANIAGLPGNYAINVNRGWVEFCYVANNLWSLEQ